MGAGRLCARFTAFSLLAASFLLGLICTLGPPTTNKFNFVDARFFLPGAYAPNAQVNLTMGLGIFGYRIYDANGNILYGTSALGYKIDNSIQLPPQTNPSPDPALDQVMNYKLNGALLLVPLQVGQTGLAIQACLIPNRIFSFITLIMAGLAMGLAGLNLLISFICFTGAADRIQQFWGGLALTHLATGQWMLLASIMCIIASIPFLFAMIPPPKRKVVPVANQTWKV